jgi:hypothetical protein
MTQIENAQLDVWIIEGSLVHLAIDFKEDGANWFGFFHHSTDRPLKGIALDGAVNLYE